MAKVVSGMRGCSNLEGSRTGAVGGDTLKRLLAPSTDIASRPKARNTIDGPESALIDKKG